MPRYTHVASGAAVGSGPYRFYAGSPDRWAGDDRLRVRIRREVRSRRPPMPGWVKRIDQIEPSRATAMMHPFGDGESVAVEVRLPDDRVCLAVA